MKTRKKAHFLLWIYHTKAVAKQMTVHWEDMPDTQYLRTVIVWEVAEQKPLFIGLFYLKEGSYSQILLILYITN